MKIRKALFPVAGLGTRFLPATKAMPKEMLPIVDKPIIQYAVEEARAAGIEEIIFVTGRGKVTLEDHFDHSHRLEDSLKCKGKDALLTEIAAIVPDKENWSISYTRQNSPLGLGHAIWCARNLIGDEPFAVLLADDLIQSEVPVLTQMIKEFERLRASIVAVIEVEKSEVSKYGIVDIEKMVNSTGLIKSLVEKPAPEDASSNLAIIGRYILTPKIFDILSRRNIGRDNEIQLTDAMSELLKEQPIFSYKFSGTRYDCGDKAGFQMANLAFALDRPEMKHQLLPFIQEMLAKHGDN